MAARAPARTITGTKPPRPTSHPNHLSASARATPLLLWQRPRGPSILAVAALSLVGVVEVEATARAPSRALVAVCGDAAHVLQHAGQSISPSVWLRSGERLSVQLMKSARRSSNRHGSVLAASGCVIGPPGPVA